MRRQRGPRQMEIARLPPGPGRKDQTETSQAIANKAAPLHRAGCRTAKPPGTAKAGMSLFGGTPESGGDPSDLGW